MDQLLNLHFILKEEVKEFVRELPLLIRRFKTSTKVKQETSHGQVRGQINWPRTMNERFRMNANDKTIFSIVERNREYAIKENLVLLEVLRVLYSILFEKIDSDHYQKYSWFEEWSVLKETVATTLHKNVYLGRIQDISVPVTDRMILDTMKHRNPLYQQAAQILYEYRQVIEGKINEEEVQQLLKETFVFPQEEDVLFELYWVVQLIRENTAEAQLQLMDGRNNMVAEWVKGEHVYRIYHDSAGSTQLKFHIDTEEMAAIPHPFVDRKLTSMAEAAAIARTSFGQGFNTGTFWSGRPDIIVEIYHRQTKALVKVMLGEVKHTNRMEYAITGLRELVDYMKLVRDKDGNYLDGDLSVEVEGLLFTDRIASLENNRDNLQLTVGNLASKKERVRVVAF
ncbi:MAG: hypothetical protein LRY73_07615 [Bacillus sp. (in: Bacteria)]|nr:hypothetical protein [Bacillus sp. (in: firmicutes)]